MPFQIIREDITHVKADAIVNTANPNPVFGNGTDRAIYEAAGAEQLLEERRKIGPIARGQAAATPAFALDAKYIIHTVGPAWKGGSSGEYEILRSCYENSLQLALQLKCRSIAFPLIATGVYGFPKDKALQIATAVIQTFVMEHDMKVILVVFDRKSFELSGSIFENVREYVDSHYVEEASKKEHFLFAQGARRPGFSGNSLPAEDVRLLKEMKPAGQRKAGASESSGKKKPLFAEKNAAEKKKVDLKELVASPEKTFQEKLFEIIDERGLTGPQVYKNYISKQVYSKIQGDKYYHPNKFTAIALCLSLHLDLEQTKDLLNRAGWTLSPSNKADLVVTGCILNGEYNLVQVDIYLFDFDCEPLSKIK